MEIYTKQLSQIFQDILDSTSLNMNHNADLFPDLSYQNSIAGLDGLKHIFSEQVCYFVPWAVALARTLRNGLKPFPGHESNAPAVSELSRLDPLKMGRFENRVLNPLADHHFFYQNDNLGGITHFQTNSCNEAINAMHQALTGSTLMRGIQSKRV